MPTLKATHSKREHQGFLRLLASKFLLQKGCTDVGPVQVLHTQPAGASLLQLPHSGHSGSGQKGRWDPSSRFLVVLDTCDGYGKGMATIWDTLTSSRVQTCRIELETYWPQWVEHIPNLIPHCNQSKHMLASEVSSMLDGITKQCFVNSPCGLLTLSGQRREFAWTQCGGRWSHMSLDGSVITTLLTNVHQCAAFLLGTCLRSAHGFRHYCTASGMENTVLLAREECAESSGDLKKSPILFCVPGCLEQPFMLLLPWDMYMS